MKKLSIFFLFIFLNSYVSFSSNDWGKTGHRATGEIAQKYLSRKAKKEINKLLDGHTIAYVSNFADEIKSVEAIFDDILADATCHRDRLAGLAV